MKKTVVELSFLTLKNIIENDVPFRIAIKMMKKSDKNLDNNLTNAVSSILGAYLRHYYLIEDLLKRELDSLEGDNKYYFSIFLSDSLFSKKIDFEQLKKEYKKIGVEPFDKLDTIRDKYSSLESINFYREEFKEGKISEFEYYNIRYNTPFWLIKMWNKHFPKSLRFILKSNIHESDSSLAVNTKLISLDEVLKNELFKESVFDDVVLYSGKQTKQLELVQAQKLYPLKEGERAALEDIQIKDDEKIIIYSEQKGNNTHLKIHEWINATNWVKYLTNSHEDYIKTREYVLKDSERENKTTNNFVSYRVDRKDIELCLLNDNEDNDLFILLPNSSNFDEIRHSPDYLLHFKPEALDELIANQKNLIETAKKYLRENGKIVYIVPTLNNKEGRNLIKDILKENEDLSLIRDRQFFPYSDFHNSLYFAILEKKGRVDND